MTDFSTITPTMTNPDDKSGKKSDAPTAPEKDEKVTVKTPYRAGKYTKSLTEMYQLIGALTAPIAPRVSAAMIDNAGDCAASLDRLAKENVQFRAFLEKLVETGAIGGVVIAHMPIVMAVGMEVAERRNKDDDETDMES